MEGGSGHYLHVHADHYSNTVVVAAVGESNYTLSLNNSQLPTNPIRGTLFISFCKASHSMKKKTTMFKSLLSSLFLGLLIHI